MAGGYYLVSEGRYVKFEEYWFIYIFLFQNTYIH